MEDVTFLYSVYPKKPIKGILENGRPINSGKSLNLTLEQVKQCMACGSVYRWFANENKLERVTSMNMERLHNEKFMTEEEFNNAEIGKIAGSNGSVINTQPEAEPVKEEPVIEKVVEEAPVAAEETPVAVVEEKVDEVANPVIEEVKVEESVEVTEAIVEEPVEAPAAEEAPAENVPPVVENNQNNYKKKKH